ncbi:MAG: TonB-dependent receptor, partial [Acidobacteria bacterium]|nr:TonB-dependent receptor [Acidobacteriota bacterium]
MRVGFVAALVGALLSGQALVAQESRATLIGKVSDTTGAVIPGAPVRVTNVATGVAVSVVTNAAGNYEVPYLLPGAYRVEVEMAGFKRSVRDAIELRVSDRLTLDFTLDVGEVTESIVVTGETPLLETATASIGLVMDERRVTELPVVGGNPFYLARLTPGVLASGGRSAGNPMDAGAATGVIVNGTRGGSSEVTVDGAPNMTNRNAVFSPPQDLVQEFKIHTATYDASIGHAAGALTNVSMKSGTNRLHGSGSYFDSRIRGVPWFTNRFLADPNTKLTPEQRAAQVPSWLHRRWGTTVTGPVWLPKLYDGRSRTFWTYGFEDLDISRNLSFTGTVPTAAEKQGDFSALLALGDRYQIYDPATTVPAGSGRFRRQPLAGNIVPASRINPMARKLLSFYPEANQAGTADARNNFFRTRNIYRENYTVTSRVDHSFTEGNRFFVRWNNSQHDNSTDTLPGITNIDLLDRTGWGLVLDDVHVFNPGLLLNLRYGLTYQSNITRRGSQGFDLASLGFPESLVNDIKTKLSPEGIAFPNITIDGAYTALGINGGNTAATYYQTVGGTVTRIAGSHSTKYGAEFRVMRETGYNFAHTAPQLVFNGVYTRGPLDNATGAPIGQGLASMLMGIASGGVVNNNASRAEQSTYTSLFVQDDWRLSRKLTVNLGLRWEYEGPITERFNRSVRDFDFTNPNPVSERALANYARAPIAEVPVSQFRTVGGLLFAGDRGQPRGLWNGDRNNFAPRVGLAYQIDKRLVVRAGYGIFYDVVGVDRNGVNLGGFNQPTNLIPTLDNGQTFVATLSNPFPNGIDVADGAAGGLSTFLGRGVSFFYGEPLNPAMQRWSASVQAELPGRVVTDVAYVGNRGTHLPVSQQWNAVPRQYLSTSPLRDQPTIDFLSAQVTNPFFGLPEFAGTGLSAQRTSRGQLLRPYPQFTGITASIPIGISWYHSLQVSAEKRMSHGLTFQSSWTYSKFMERTEYLNDSDPRPEEVISPQDFTHRFVLSGIYELPFGRGKKFMTDLRGVPEFVLGGWQLQGWFEGQTGEALGWGNILFLGNIKDVEIPVSERRAERWFNIDAGFNRNSKEQLASNIRTFPQRFTGIRGDGINNFDL